MSCYGGQQTLPPLRDKACFSDVSTDTALQPWLEATSFALVLEADVCRLVERNPGWRKERGLEVGSTT